MESNTAKTSISVTIWIATAIICFGIAIYGAVTTYDVKVLFALCMMIAIAATGAVWTLPIFEERSGTADLTPEQDKAKRQPADKLALLMELMDEAEREAFKEALKQRVLEEAGSRSDGELPYDLETLEALTYGEEAGRHHAP